MLINWKSKQGDIKTNGRITTNQRICKNCNSGEVEDEIHAIMSCLKYDNSRAIMVQTLNETFPYFELLDYKENFLFIIKCNDYEITHPLSKMLSEIKQTEDLFEVSITFY